MSSRSPGVREFGAWRRTSTRSLSGLAVSGRKAIAPRMPGRPSGSLMCAMRRVLSRCDLFGEWVGGCGCLREEEAADGVAAEDDDQTYKRGDGVVHEDHEVDDGAAEEEDDGCDGEPPSAHGLRHAEESGDGEC